MSRDAGLDRPPFLAEGRSAVQRGGMFRALRGPDRTIEIRSIRGDSPKGGHRVTWPFGAGINGGTRLVSVTVVALYGGHGLSTVGQTPVIGQADLVERRVDVSLNVDRPSWFGFSR